MQKLPAVREYMDTVVHTLRPETDILDAVGFLLENHVTGAPVVNERNELIGLLSEKDCLRLLSLGDGDELPTGTVADFMTKEVQSVTPGMNVYFAAGMFLNANWRRFPVVEGKNRKVVGGITRFDILRAIQANLVVRKG